MFQGDMSDVTRTKRGHRKNGLPGRAALLRFRALARHRVRRTERAEALDPRRDVGGGRFGFRVNMTRNYRRALTALPSMGVRKIAMGGHGVACPAR